MRHENPVEHIPGRGALQAARPSGPLILNPPCLGDKPKRRSFALVLLLSGFFMLHLLLLSVCSE